MFDTAEKVDRCVAPQYEQEVEATVVFDVNCEWMDVGDTKEPSSNVTTVSDVRWAMHVRRTGTSDSDVSLVFKLICLDPDLVRECEYDNHMQVYAGEDLTKHLPRRDSANAYVCEVPKYLFDNRQLSIRVDWTFYKVPLTDFSRPLLSDFSVVIDDHRLFVSSELLAMHSAFFYDKIFGAEGNRDLNEITLTDVTYEEFRELLRVLYPEKKRVTPANFGFLLELAKQFDIPHVKFRCYQEYLQASRSRRECFRDSLQTDRYRPLFFEILLLDGANKENLSGRFPLHQLDTVTLMVEGQKVTTSREYLALYSPYFFTMFYGNFTQQAQTTVQMHGVGFDELSRVFSQLECDRPPVSVSLMAELLHLAERFDVPRLRNMCARAEVSGTQIDAELLALADTYGLARLRARILFDPSFRSGPTFFASFSPVGFSKKTRTAIRTRLNELRQVDPRHLHMWTG